MLVGLNSRVRQYSGYFENMQNFLFRGENPTINKVAGEKMVLDKAMLIFESSH